MYLYFENKDECVDGQKYSKETNVWSLDRADTAPRQSWEGRWRDMKLEEVTF